MGAKPSNACKRFLKTRLGTFLYKSRYKAQVFRGVYGGLCFADRNIERAESKLCVNQPLAGTGIA